MTNTPFSKQCEILAELVTEFDGEEWAVDFCEINDLGVPYALGIILEHLTLTEAGMSIVTDTFHNLCKNLGIDEIADYDSLDNMLDISGLFSERR